MAKHKIAFVTRDETTDVTWLEQALAGLDYEMSVHTRCTPGEAIEAIKGADVIVNQVVPFSREVIDEIDTASAIVSFGHGFDHIDADAATDRGIMVVNCAGYCSEEVANHTVMLLLACAKKLTLFHDIVKSGQWDAGTHDLSLDLPPIDGQVLGIVGLGNIGRATARRAVVFGLEVIAYDPHVPPWITHEYRVQLAPDLNELASRSDYVSIHVPLSNETSKLIGEPFFRAMKPTAYFINTCRGGTVDEQALTRALQEGEIAGAGLDVFEQEPTPADNPLLKMANVIVTPHSAGGSVASTSGGKLRVGGETARILRRTWPMSLANPEVRSKIPSRPPATNR